MGAAVDSKQGPDFEALVDNGAFRVIAKLIGPAEAIATMTSALKLDSPCACQSGWTRTWVTARRASVQRDRNVPIHGCHAKYSAVVSKMLRAASHLRRKGKGAERIGGTLPVIPGSRLECCNRVHCPNSVNQEGV